MQACTKTHHFEI